MGSIAQAQTGTVAPHLDFSVVGNAVYDNNVSRSSRALADLRGLSREDIRFTPALEVDGLIPLGRQSLTIVGSAGYDFYRRNQRLNRERLRLDTALALRFARCDATLTANYARRQSELDDLVLLADPTQTRGRVSNTEDIKSIGASGACGAEVGLRPTASIRQTWTDNSQNRRRFGDFRRTDYSAGIAYARPSLGTITLFGTYQTTSFPNRPALAGFGGSGFDLKGGGARFERQIGSRLLGLAELSYVRVDPETPGVPDFDGPTWRVSLTAQASSRLEATLDVSRAVDPSNRVNASYLLSRIYRFGARYALGPRLTLDGSVRQGSRDFRGVGTTLIPVIGEPLLRDRTRSYTAGLQFQPREPLILTVGATHETRNANGRFYDYTSNRINAGVSWRF